MKLVLNFILLVVFCSTIEAKKNTIDFGIQGALYDIEEKNIYDTLKDSVKKYLSEHNITKEIQNSVEKKLIYRSEKKQCSQDTFEKIPFLSKYKTDIFNPLGRLVYKKNDTLVNNASFPYDILFVDGNNTSYKKTVSDFVLKTKGLSPIKYTVFVANRNIRNADFDEIYPSSDDSEAFFHVRCYPTVIHVEGNYIYKYEIGDSEND